MDDVVEMYKELKDLTIIFVNCGQLKEYKNEIAKIAKRNTVIEVIVFPPVSETARRKIAEIVIEEIKEGRFPCPSSGRE